LKKVIIITYYWPPSGGSGVQRWLKFAKYLPQNGWQPIIYTPENPSYDLKDESLLADIPNEAIVLKQKIWEPYSLYQKLSGRKKAVKNYGFTNSNKKTPLQKTASWIRGNLFIPDPRVTWVKPSIKFLQQYIQENKVEHIITTGPPHSMHLIGLGLKKVLPNLKWIADMRDPWANFDVLHQFNLSNKSLKKQKQLEKNVLDVANIVLFVSEGQVSDFQELDQNKIEIITNGFDEEDFTITENEPTEKFTISHVGLLNELRNPIALFVAINNLAKKNQSFSNMLHLRFVGNVSQQIKKAALNYKLLKDKIEFIDYLSHVDVINEYQNAALLLLMPNQTENGKGQIPGKVFEYMAAKKPILTLGFKQSSIALIVTESKIGLVAEYDNVNDISIALEQLFQQYQNKVAFEADKKIVEQYTRAKLTKRLSDLLNSL